jgi:hypothetical protein
MPVLSLDLAPTLGAGLGPYLGRYLLCYIMDGLGSRTVFGPNSGPTAHLTREADYPQWPVPTPKPNRWHPVMLPDDYIREMKQDLSEVDVQVESKTRYEPDPDAPPPSFNQTA